MALSRKGLDLINVISRFSPITALTTNTGISSSFLTSSRYNLKDNGVLNLPSNICSTNVNVHIPDLGKIHLNKSALVCIATEKSASPNQNKQEYQCPSRLLEHFSQLVILDTATSPAAFYDCPVASGYRDSLEAPTAKNDKIVESPGMNSPAKEAKLILRIRHKKMKRHKLKKLRKRMYFLWSRQKRARKAKRKAKYYKELEEIKKTGESFNPESFVKEQLAKARKGGFYINVFESKSL